MKMKLIVGIRVALLLLVASLSVQLAQAQPGDAYKLEFTVKGAKDTTAYLANYYGKQLYYRDTAQIDSKGYFYFDGNKPLKPGIYAVAIAGSKYFEIIVNEPTMAMETDTANFVKYMKVKQSEENKVFYDYIQYIGDQKIKAEPMRQQVKDLGPNDPAAKKLQKKLDELDAQVLAYQHKLIKKHSNLLVGKVVSMSLDVEVPNPPKGVTDTALYQHYYTRQHYFDGFDFNEPGIVNSPIFHNKLAQFFNRTVPQQPDTVFKEALRLVKMLEHDPEMFKYVVHFITYNFETSKVMCIDAVFVYMVDEFYKTGRATWMDEKNLKTVIDRANKIAPTLCQNKVPYLKLQDVNGEWHSLYDQKNEYVILAFWDPTCSHCKKELPRLKTMMAKYKEQKADVGIFGVVTEFENKDWPGYIKEHEIDWLNVSDNPEFPNRFRTTFDIYSTPKLYLLDKEKRIIAKQLDTEALEKMIDHLLKQREGKGDNGLN